MIIGMDVLGTVAELSIDFKRENVYLTANTPRGEIIDQLKVMHGVLGASGVSR
jgi:hypothetical protein